MTREEWVELAGGLAAAVEYEAQILSAGREFLTAEARAVLDGEAPSPAYWDWLASQLPEATS